jgi:hypothetical protein
MSKENVRVLFSVDDPNYDWESAISKQNGYEFISHEKLENQSNKNWPKWSIIINYKRNCK